MSSRRRIPKSRALFEDHAIVAQENTEHGVWTGCSLSLRFDQARTRGMVSLRLKAEFNEVDARYVTLQLSPENFHEVGTDFDPEKVPTSIKQHFGYDIVPQSHGQILIISVSMNNPGRLITPKDAAILTPTSEHQTTVQNFQCLCQATRLILYIPTRDFPRTRRSALESFTSLARAGSLASTPSDLRDAYTGRGGRESTWGIFNITEPPPSYESQTEQVTFKRTREESPASQTGISHKKVAGDSKAASRGLPAYVSNTDSDTAFLHLSSPSQPSHAAVSPESSSVQQKLVQEMLHAELNAALPDLLRKMLPGLIRAQLRDLLPDALKDFIIAPASSQDNSEGENFIERVVVQHLPQAVRDYISLEDPVEDYLYNADVAIEEARYSAVLEVKEAADESISEIKQVETDVVERLTGVDWNVIGKEIMGLTPSQESCYDGARRADAHPGRSSEQDISRDGMQHQGLGELLDMESEIRTSNAQRNNRLSSWADLQSATTEDMEAESLGQQSPEALRARSELANVSADTTRQKSPAVSSECVWPTMSGEGGGAELNTDSGRKSTDIRVVGESDRDECEERVENQTYPGTQQGQVLGMTWTDSWMYGTTEPDTEDTESNLSRND